MENTTNLVWHVDSQNMFCPLVGPHIFPLLLQIKIKFSNSGSKALLEIYEMDYREAPSDLPLTCPLIYRLEHSFLIIIARTRRKTFQKKFVFTCLNFLIIMLQFLNVNAAISH